VSAFGSALGVAGVMFSAVLLLVGMAVGASRWAEHRRMKRARLADATEQEPAASRARQETAVAGEERPELVPGNGYQARHWIS
jgi:hypothetical protein